ncbi:hypothetical protein [Polaribacter aquimarinus]|uniref:PqqD family protein n=1 Tax=Polaribacter aquimarinus TaxID=2100726 RepID=A0A2U2JBT2_9FLAO|nr:hypothetical protein [Polaribacter aquimarinus]PWG05799.1 hypothetical protein DIS07_04970 [Polaribacter aquimarinus]
MSYIVLNPRHIADAFDRDIIIANLDSGIYYTLTGSICKLFNDLPINKSEALNLVNEDESMIKVYNQLIEEEIFIESPVEIDFNIKGLNSKDSPSMLKKFDDLQDLLVLDPIHEVESEKWNSDSKR